MSDWKTSDLVTVYPTRIVVFGPGGLDLDLSSEEQPIGSSEQSEPKATLPGIAQ